MLKKSRSTSYPRAHTTDNTSILILQPENIPEPEATASGEELYFEVLELQPIKLSISFMRTERVSSEEQSVVL